MESAKFDALLLVIEREGFESKEFGVPKMVVDYGTMNVTYEKKR